MMSEPSRQPPVSRAAGPLVRLWDRAAAVMARLGVGPFHLLTVRGRKTGRPRSVPVVLVVAGDDRWLVAPYGAVGWVHNVRAAGRVHLRRGREAREYAVRELEPAAAGPVLKRYVAVASATRSSFTATPEAPAEAFAAEAARHPVFALLPLAPSTAAPDH